MRNRGIINAVRALFARRGLAGSTIGCAVVGLGNPGLRHRGTRHNVGFAVANRYAGSLGCPRSFSDCLSRVVTGVGSSSGAPVAVLRPQTFMNASGDAVRQLVECTALRAEHLLVVVDDFHLPLGTIRLRGSGSHGGHNGLKSIEAVVGEGFPRLRIGVGPLEQGCSVVEFVLGRFKPCEGSAVAEVVERGAAAVGCFVCEGIERAMSRFNG